MAMRIDEWASLIASLALTKAGFPTSGSKMADAIIEAVEELWGLRPTDDSYDDVSLVG